MDHGEQGAGCDQNGPRVHAPFFESAPKKSPVDELFDDGDEGGAEDRKQVKPDGEAIIGRVLSNFVFNKIIELNFLDLNI